MIAVLLAGDIVRVAGPGGDEAVQALAQLREGDVRPGEAERQIAVDEQPRVGWTPLPRTEQPGGHGIRLGPDAEQPLPHLGRAERVGRARHGVTRTAAAGTLSTVISARYSAKESTSPASNSFPFSAEAKDGRPTTPDSV